MDPKPYSANLDLPFWTKMGDTVMSSIDGALPK